MKETTNDIKELLNRQDKLLQVQRELYFSAITNINLRNKEILNVNFGSLLAKNCLWDMADMIVIRFFHTADYYISPQQLYDRFVHFSYDVADDFMISSASIRKIVYESQNGNDILNDIKETCFESQKKLFEKEKFITGSGKIKKEYKDAKLISRGKENYRENKKNHSMQDELTGVSQNELSHPLEVDHVQSLAAAKYNSRYLKENGMEELKEFYNSNENFQYISKIANQSKGDIRIFANKETQSRISEVKLQIEKQKLVKSYTDKFINKGFSKTEASQKAKQQVQKDIENQYVDVTYKATAKEIADAIKERWENPNIKQETKDKLIKSGELNKDGKVPEDVYKKLERNLRNSMNEESKTILKQTDYKKVAIDSGKYTSVAIKKIIAGQVIYYVLPPVVFETQMLIKKKNMNVDKFFVELEKSKNRVFNYVNKHLGDILKNTAGNTTNHFIKTFFDILIEMAKETVRRFLKILKQVVLTVVNCIKIMSKSSTTPEEKADAVAKLISFTVTTVVLEVLFEVAEVQLGLPDILMEPLQIGVTVLVTNLIMLILEKADLFNVKYGLLLANIDRIFVEEEENYLLASKQLLEESSQDWENIMENIKSNISRIEHSIENINLYSQDVTESLNIINKTFHMDIDFDKEWSEFISKRNLMQDGGEY